MITITAANDTQEAKAREVMDHEIMSNPNLNGAEYEILRGDEWETGIEIDDQYLGRNLHDKIFNPHYNEQF